MFFSGLCHIFDVTKILLMKKVLSLLLFTGFTGAIIAQNLSSVRAANTAIIVSQDKNKDKDKDAEKDKDKKKMTEKERLRHHHPHHHDKRETTVRKKR